MDTKTRTDKITIYLDVYLENCVQTPEELRAIIMREFADLVEAGAKKIPATDPHFIATCDVEEGVEEEDKEINDWYRKNRIEINKTLDIMCGEKRR